MIKRLLLGISKLLLPLTLLLGVTLGSSCGSPPVLTIVFTTSPQLLDAGKASGAITVQLRDDENKSAGVKADTTIYLTSTSSTGRFDITPSGLFDGNTTSVTIPKDATSVSFYYRDTTAGTPTLTATETPSLGWNPGAQQATINPAAPSNAGLSRENPLPLGESLVTSDGTEITVLNLTQGNQAWDILQGVEQSFNASPESGMQYALVSVKVKNISSQKEPWPYSDSPFDLVGSSDNVFSVNNKVNLPKEGVFSELHALLNHGGETAGSICFYIPQDETNLVLGWQSADVTNRRFFEVKPFVSVPPPPQTTPSSLVPSPKPTAATPKSGFPYLTIIIGVVLGLAGGCFVYFRVFKLRANAKNKSSAMAMKTPPAREVAKPAVEMATETIPVLEVAQKRVAEANEIKREPILDTTRRTVEAADEKSPEPVSDLLLEIERNRGIAFEPKTANLIAFQTKVWDSSNDKVYSIPASVREELSRAYSEMSLANGIVWLATEQGRRSQNLDDNYARLCASVAERLTKVEQSTEQLWLIKKP